MPIRPLIPGIIPARVCNRRPWPLLAMALGLLALGGCTRRYYHDYADRDVYGILRERMFDWRWNLPPRPVEADPRSRMADPADPNHEPIPPDEVAARQFQVSSAFPFEYHGWKKRGTAPVEYLDWQREVPVGKDGKVLLSRDSIMRLAVVNSREYQFNIEDVYLAALSLTLARFQFMIQGFSNWSSFYQQRGSGKTSSNQLQLLSSNGFDLELMSGAQMMINLANSLVFEYSGKGFQVASPNLLVNFTQPLLRGAWARIVTQQLSIEERGVLYAVRGFAHYRREFYVGLVAGTGYLNLLNVLQGIRNQERNLISLQRNLDEYEECRRAGIRTVLERDQIAQNYQSTQLGLLQAEAGLQTELDLFKIQLGIPPELEVRLDDSVLDPFQLNNPRLDEIRTTNEALFLTLLQNEELPRAELMTSAGKLQAEYGSLEPIHAEAVKELAQFQRSLNEERKNGFSGPDAGEKKALYERKARLAQQLEKALEETADSVADDRDDLASYIAKLEQTPLPVATKNLRDLVGKEFRARLSEIFVAQTQIRVFLIQLTPMNVTVDQAIQIALGNRLDLKNVLARVTDAWRIEEVEANSLQGFLNFVYSGNLASAPSHETIFRFDSSASVHRFGLQFDAPINRRLERNRYRASQIAFQRARRAYMLLRDQIVEQIRFDMRELLLRRKQFDIGREQLITTSRQLEEAEFALRIDTEGKPVTLNLLAALRVVLEARNTLISTWVGYETARYNLYRDFDLMDIDGNGVWTNENDPALLDIALRLAAADPAPSLAIPARIPDLSGDESRGTAFFSDIRPSDRVIPDESGGAEGPLTPPELMGPPSAGRISGPGASGERPPSPPDGPSPFAPQPSPRP